MKKFFYVMTEIILFLISVIVFTKPALADVNYDITNVDVTARVNPNGSLSMERRITYKFDDDAHGIFYYSFTICLLKNAASSSLASLANSSF